MPPNEEPQSPDLPDQPPPPAPPASAEQPDPAKTDAYAQSLLQALNAQIEVEQRNNPPKTAFSKKKIIIIIAITISTVLTLVAFASIASKASKPLQSGDTTELLKYSK